GGVSCADEVDTGVVWNSNLLKDNSRERLLYVAIAKLVSLNLILVIHAKMVENQVLGRTRNLFKKGSPFRDSLLIWVYSFGGVVNLNLLLLVFYILRINNFGGNAPSGFDILYYLIPFLLVGWIVALFILLGKKIQQVQDTK